MEYFQTIYLNWPCNESNIEHLVQGFALKSTQTHNKKPLKIQTPKSFFFLNHQI